MTLSDPSGLDDSDSWWAVGLVFGGVGGALLGQAAASDAKASAVVNKTADVAKQVAQGYLDYEDEHPLPSGKDILKGLITFTPTTAIPEVSEEQQRAVPWVRAWDKAQDTAGALGLRDYRAATKNALESRQAVDETAQTFSIFIAPEAAESEFAESSVAAKASRSGWTQLESELGTPAASPGPGTRSVPASEPLDNPAHSSAQYAKLKADLKLAETVSNKNIRLRSPLAPGDSYRASVFDLETGKLTVGKPTDVGHVALLENMGVDVANLPEGRYVGGWTRADTAGNLIFDPRSGTLPYNSPDIPSNALDRIRGTGVSVVRDTK